MKKIVSLVLAVMLAAMCCSVFVAAEDIYTFHVDGINRAHAGEDNFISNSNDALANANTKWAITIHLKHVEGNVYEAVVDAIVGKGESAPITLGEGEIAFSVHSSTSNVDEIDQYPNVNDKNAALEIKAGTYFVFNGVTAEQIMAGELPEGVTVVATSTKPAAETPSEEPSEEPSEDAPISPAPATENKNIAPKATVLNSPSYENLEGQWPASYTGKVNDGVIASRSDLGLKGVTWAAFYKGNEASDKDNFDGTLGEIVLDFGAKEDFTSFRTHIWGTASSGIGEMSKVEFFVSDDNQNWTSVGAVTDGLTGDGVWVELEKAASGRYVKYAYTMSEANKGVYMFVSECEAYATVAATSDPSEKPVDPADTADNGIVALAIISAIAVAGAVIVKKSR